MNTKTTTRKPVATYPVLGLLMLLCVCLTACPFIAEWEWQPTLEVAINGPDLLEVNAGIPFSLQADLTIIDTQSPEPVSVDTQITWTDNDTQELLMEHVDMIEGAGTSRWQGKMEPGVHHIRVIAEFESGDYKFTRFDEVTIIVVNPVPVVSILAPEHNATFCQGAEILFRAEATDYNGALQDNHHVWSIGRPNSLPQYVASGQVYTTFELGVGAWNANITVTDAHGAQGSNSVQVNVLDRSHPDCLDLPPAAHIKSPANNTTINGNTVTDEFYVLAHVRLEAEATDPEDDPSELSIVWKSSFEGKIGEGLVLETDILAEDPCGGGAVDITLEVTDSAGNVTTDSITLYLQWVC